MTDSAVQDKQLASSARSSVRGSRRSDRTPAALASLLFAIASALACGGRNVDKAPEGSAPEAGSGGMAHGSEATAGGANFGGSSSSGQQGRASGGSTTGTATTTFVPTGGVAGSPTTPFAPTGGVAGSPTTPFAPTGGVAGSPTTTFAPTGGVAGIGGVTGIGGGTFSPAGGTTSTTATTPDLLYRLPKLRALPEWSQLKELWKELDAVLPKTGVTPVPYADTITDEQRKTWLAELEAAVGALQSSGLLLENELAFLREIVTGRVEAMRDGGYFYELYLHRAPGLFEGATETSLESLEQKLDVLESLRAKCRIDADAYQLALEQVEREATVFFVMDQLTLLSRSTYPGLSLPKDLAGAELVSELKTRLAEAESPSMSDAQRVELEALRARLDAIESTVVQLPAFLQELERCE